MTKKIVAICSGGKFEYDQKELHKILGEICGYAHCMTLAFYIHTGSNEYQKTGK